MATSKLPPQRSRAAKPKAFDIDEFEAVESQIASARDELLVLVKKSPHDALSKFKLSVVNGLLLRANALLGNDRPMADFEQFDTEVLPSASDAAMVLGQYLAALENLRVKQIKQKHGLWYWAEHDQPTDRRTYPPRKLEK
jgi:hypothetical protein